MQKILFIVSCLFSSIIIASSIAQYSVDPGTLHTGGSAEVQNLTHESKFVVHLKYLLKKKFYVPIDDEKLKGEIDYELPIEFKTERGYQELEALKVIELEKAHLKFIKRLDFKNYKKAYQFQVVPKNGKSIVDVVYHPAIPGVGWGKIDILIMINKLGIDHYQITLRALKI